MICPYFTKTKIKLRKKHTIADECQVCPLRDETGDCIKDIHEDASEMALKC